MIEFILMNEEKIRIIADTRKSLEDKRGRTRKISRLVNKKIDRKHHLDLNDLTPSELDFEMSRRAANLRENIDPRVYLNLKPGRNKLVRIFMLIPFFIRLIFIKPVSIIRDFIFFNNAMIVRMRNSDLRLSEMEQELGSLKDEEKLYTAIQNPGG